MKVAFFELNRSVGVNGQALAFDRLRQLPVKISASIRLRELSRAIGIHIQDLFEEHNNLIKRHGVEKDGTWVVEKAGENVAFQADVQRLMAQVVELKGERLTLTDLFTASGLEDAKFAANDLDALDWLIDDGVTERIDPEPPAEEEVDPVNTEAAESSEGKVLDLPPRSATA